MKIGLNAIGFNPGSMGGVETYFRQLLHHLQLLDDGPEYLLVCRNSEEGCFTLRNERFSMMELGYGRPSLRWFLRGVLFETARIDIITPAMNRVPVELFHHPFTVVEPLRSKIPSVLTFWDMQQEFYPEFFTRRELRFRDYAYRASAQIARRIIVSSEFTRTCLVERYGVKPYKIDVVYTGYGSEYRPIDDADALDVVRKRHSLPDRFIYYPAALWPHKNHRLLLDAVCQVRDKHGVDARLVLSGMSTGRAGELREEIRKRNLSGVVTLLGYLPYAELPYLYNLAAMMIFPSLFEGFGIPLVEAMACGCPVACSNATSLPEVVGEGVALLFDPHSPAEIASAIVKVHEDGELRSRMSLAGLRRAQQFDWRRTALETQAVYERACG